MNGCHECIISLQFWSRSGALHWEVWLCRLVMFSKPSVTIHVEQKLHNTNNYKLVCKLNRGSALFHKPNQHINVNWLALSCIVFWNYLFKFMSFNLSTSPDCFIQQGVHDRQTSGLSFARVHQVPTFSHTCMGFGHLVGGDWNIVILIVVNRV